MNRKNHTRAKILTLIPVAVTVVTAACLCPLIIDYVSTGSDVTAIALILFVSAALVLTTLPCLVMSAFGTMYASRAKKEGIEESGKFFVLGIIELVFYGAGTLFALIAVLMTIIAAAR